MGGRLERNRGWLVVTAVLAALLGVASAPVAAQGVAMVTDVSGKVIGQGPVTIMAEIPAETRVQVEAGARLTVIYFRSGDEYTVTGPAQVLFRAAEPQAISGAAPQKRASPVARGGSVAIGPVAVKPAAFVMRSARPTARIRLLTPSGTKILDMVPEFRWQELESGLTYRFELTDDTGKSLHESEVRGAAVRLPASVKLQEGVSYTWEVSARTQDGRRYMSAGDFSVASADLRSQAGALRPGAGALVSDRVAYAAWLERVELRDEARKHWKALSAERPEDAKLKELAGE